MKSVAVALVLGCQVALAQVPVPAPQDLGRRVLLVLPFKPEHNANVLARAMQPRLSEFLGQPVVIQNVPGRDGADGAEFVAKATLDGSVLLLGAGHTMVVDRIYGKNAVNPMQDLIPVTRIGNIQGKLLVRRAIRADDFSQLVAYADSSHRKLRFGTPQGLSPSWVAFLELMQLGKLKMLCREYEDTYEAADAVAKGEIDVVVGFGDPASQVMKTGKVRSLDYPPPGISLWLGIFLPGATPKEVVDQVHVAALKTLRSPDVVEKLKARHLVVEPDESPDAFQRFLAQETQRWTAVVRNAEIQ